MGVGIKQAVIEALRHRLFPVLARWFLQAGVSVQEAIDLLRAAAIAEALKSIPEGVSPRSISLTSIRTGLSRRLIRESLAARDITEESQPGAGGHRGERVLAGWWHDLDFRDGLGRPRILPISKGRHSFDVLCRRYSGERQSRTILKDLQQVGAVAVLPGKRVQVLRQSYAAAEWTEAGQAAMAEQLAEHIETCLHNFKHPQGSQHLLCRRVVNAFVRPEYAKILQRNIRSQIDGQADIWYDMLTDPQHTANPLDPKAVHISVTSYFYRNPVLEIQPSPQGPEPLPQAEDTAAVAQVARTLRDDGVPPTKSKRRGG